MKDGFGPLRRFAMAFVALLWLGSTACGAARAAEAPPIAAAADLNAALPEIASLFTKTTGKTVKLVFGSSGEFAQQIQNGAPFEVFLSADESYVARLASAGKTVDGGRLYAIGQIGLFAPHGSPIQVDPMLHDVAASLGDGRLKTFVIANPSHAPYGRAAREALIHAGLWDAIQPRLVTGENIAQATQFVVTGSAQAGIIPLSLALTPQVKAAGTFSLLPATWYQPLKQRVVLIKGAGETAQAFYAFLQQPDALAVLRRYGFTIPGKAD